jgi:hypothetical protein
MMGQKGQVIQSLDLIDVIDFIDKKNKTFQAITLHQLEEILGKDSPEFIKCRGVILDSFNDYKRAVVKAIFGDIEYMIK